MGKAQRLLSNAGTFDLAIPRERSGTPSDALFDGIAAFQAQAGRRRARGQDQRGQYRQGRTSAEKMSSHDDVDAPFRVVGLTAPACARG